MLLYSDTLYLLVLYLLVLYSPTSYPPQCLLPPPPSHTAPYHSWTSSSPPFASLLAALPVLLLCARGSIVSPLSSLAALSLARTFALPNIASRQPPLPPPLPQSPFAPPSSDWFSS